MSLTTSLDTVNTWYHLGFVRNHSTGKLELFIDGLLFQEGTGFSTNQFMATRVFIGNDQDSEGGDFHSNN